MSKIVFIGLCALVLSACSPEKLFELVAKSDIEQAASESVGKSSEVITAFDESIKAKKTEYAYSTKLESTSADASFGYLFGDSVKGESKKSYEIHAVLPPLDSETHYFEAWLVEKNSNAMVSMGRMVFDETTNSRSVTFKGDKQWSFYKSIIITTEDGVAPKPGTTILTGTLEGKQ